MNDYFATGNVGYTVINQRTQKHDILHYEFSFWESEFVANMWGITMPFWFLYMTPREIEELEECHDRIDREDGFTPKYLITDYSDIRYQQ